MRFYDDEGTSNSFLNDEARYCLKGVHTIRVGAEYRPIPEFALRIGYNYSTALFQKDAFKNLYDESLTTDTDYGNAQALNNYTAGIGYKGKYFYADLAYKYTTQKSDFYPFAYWDTDKDGNVTNSLTPAKVTDNRSQLILTLGFRF
jgi:opacity protein-like surface antigen